METFSPELRKGVLPSRHSAPDVQTGVPYFLRFTAANSLGFGKYGDGVAMAKAAMAPVSPGNLTAGVALHVNEVGIHHSGMLRHHAALDRRINFAFITSWASPNWGSWRGLMPRAVLRMRMAVVVEVI